MKTTELISIIKKYLDEEVRLIIRTEIKLAFKELLAENINPKQVIQKQLVQSKQIKKPISENVNSVKKVIRSSILPIPVKTGNTIIDNILAQTKQEMINNPVNVSDEPDVDNETINALMTKSAIPVGRTISMTTSNIAETPQMRAVEGTSYNYTSDEVEMAEPSYENMDGAKVPSIDDFINMKR